MVNIWHEELRYQVLHITTMLSQQCIYITIRPVMGVQVLRQGGYLMLQSQVQQLLLI